GWSEWRLPHRRVVEEDERMEAVRATHLQELRAGNHASVPCRRVVPTDERRRHYCHRRGSTPDVARPVLPVQRPTPVAYFRGPGHDGLRLPRGTRRTDSLSGPPGHSLRG